MQDETAERYQHLEYQAKVTIKYMYPTPGIAAGAIGTVTDFQAIGYPHPKWNIVVDFDGQEHTIPVAEAYKLQVVNN